jgi:hypothetical protein
VAFFRFLRQPSRRAKNSAQPQTRPNAAEVDTKLSAVPILLQYFGLDIPTLGEAISPVGLGAAGRRIQTMSKRGCATPL